MPNRYRHSYLHLTEAADPSHVLSASQELRAHKGTGGKYRAGHLFVDTADAAEAARNLLDEHIEQVNSQRARHARTVSSLRASGATPREIMEAKARLDRAVDKHMDLSHARQNIVSLDGPGSQLRHFGTSEENPDKLYVKGHGNARMDRGVVTKVSERDPEDRTHSRGFKAMHRIEDIASGVKQIRERWPGMELQDIRLTSCGSGGGYSYESGVMSEDGTGAASKLKQELSRIDTDRTYKVQGYRGSTNTTFPTLSPTGDGSTHFHTKMNFPDMPDRPVLRMTLPTMLGHPSMTVSPGTRSESNPEPTPHNPQEASFTERGRQRVETATTIGPLSGRTRLFDTHQTRTQSGLSGMVRRSKTRTEV